jgi:hypothetical protein
MIYFKAALVVNFSQDSDDVILSPLKRKRESAAVRRTVRAAK